MALDDAQDWQEQDDDDEMWEEDQEEEKDAEALIAEAEELLADGEVFVALLRFGKARADERLWELFHQFEKENIEDAIDALGCISDLEAADIKLLEIARQYEKTDPDIALMAIDHRPVFRVDEEHLRGSRDEEADVMTLRIADTMGIAGNTRTQISALMTCYRLERFPDRLKELAGAVDAFMFEVQDRHDVAEVATALDLLGREDEADTFQRQFDDSSTIPPIYLQWRGDGDDENGEEEDE